MMDRRGSLWGLLTLAWAVNMFWLSTETFGVQHTKPLFEQFLDLLHIHLSEVTITLIHTSLRKLAHVTEYGVLTLLVYRSIAGRGELRWQPYAARWSILACALYGLSDELHQVFVAGRGPSLVDWSIDVAGIAAAMALIYKIANRTRARACSLSLRAAAIPRS